MVADDVYMLPVFKQIEADILKQMKGIPCRNVQKYVLNHNRQVLRHLQSSPSSSLHLQNILGLSNTQSILGNLFFCLSSQQILYYTSQYFIVHNLLSKDSTVIKRQKCQGHKILFMQKFVTERKSQIIFTVQKYQKMLYIGQLEVFGSVTEGKRDKNGEKQKNYTWKVSKLNSKYTYQVQDLSYHPTKGYLYLLASQTSNDKIQKHLWVYDLKRQFMIMSPLLKPSLAKTIINHLYISPEPCEIYLYGPNYFRMWVINFNEKTLKQSNYRNIQRALFKKNIIKVFPMSSKEKNGSIGVLTENVLVVVGRNQLKGCQLPPQKSIKEIKDKDNIEVQLENSLNQIYRMKFLFDEEVKDYNPNDDLQHYPSDECQDNHFVCSSDIFLGQQGQCITIATKSGTLLTYSLSSQHLKLVSTLSPPIPHQFDVLQISRKGQVLLLSENNYQNFYIVNKYVLNSEEKEEIKPFWGMGQISRENMVDIDSPAAHERMCTLGEHNIVKLWAFRGKEKKIVFQQRLKNKANTLAMHPGGLLLALNFPKEIKLMSILPTGLYQVMSAKTNYNSTSLRYSDCGNYLVSNQQNLLIFYNPFTLHTLGYIEPPQLKSKVVDFQITPEGNHIAYLTSENSFYVQNLQLNSGNKFDNITAAHNQMQKYTCFYFDNNVNKTTSNKNGEQETLFIGCTQHKYMVLYRNYAKELIVEYPVEDCYITKMCVADGWLFAATSHNSIRVYKWPIRESQCQMEILNFQNKCVKYKAPTYQEFFFWSDQQKISKMHKLRFTNKIVITREGGIKTVLAYNKYYAEKFEEAGEKKKLTQIINDTYFITKNESEKRNRLIEKTQGDISKIENEIAKEKNILERKYLEECSQKQRNFQQKMQIQQQQKSQYLKKMQQQNLALKAQIQQKRAYFDSKKLLTSDLYGRKKNYQDSRNDTIQKNIEAIVAEHKEKIAAKIAEHKKNINDVKGQYRDKICQMKNQFQNMVAKQYPDLVTNSKQKSSEPVKDEKKCQETLSCQINDEEIMELNQKVDQTNRQNEALEKQLEELKRKVRSAQLDDENLQKEFQKCLEQYNSNRFSNLSLHSEVLKMRTQLLQRKEIMDNKQQIINVAFQERQKLQNYKSLVKGSLTKFSQKKSASQATIFQKQNQMTAIYSQLAATFNEYEAIKRQDQRLADLLQVHQKDKKAEQAKIQKAVTRLKEIKRYLLLQGLTEDIQQKEMYAQQQNLLTTINFYKKRMSMQKLKEKKNKLLKKSALNLVLKQNKNLLEQCNQLREQTINHEHQITNLGRKLGEANRMISIEHKLKDQKNVVNQQRNQLEAIRALFNGEINSYNTSEKEIRIEEVM